MDIDNLIQIEFPQAPGLIYLNHAAVSPWPQRTARAVRTFAEENMTTGAKYYSNWVKKEAALRRQLQKLINAPSPDDIALLKNTSEALSVVACGLDWQAGENVVSTDQEFPSNRIVWQAQKRHGIEFREVNIEEASDPEEALMAACDSKTRVMTISSVQYGTGFRLDLERLGHFCHKNSILYCVDAIQSIGAHQFDVQAIRADFAMADGHKWMLGPEGIAVFYCGARLREPLQLYEYGWHMVEDHVDFDAREWQIANSARRFECGSPNMLGIHALSASISLIAEIGLENIERNIINNTSYLIDKLKNINAIQLLTPVEEKQRAGIVTFRVTGQDMAKLHRKLLENNIICAHRLGGIRLSPHFYNSHAQIDNTLEILLSTI